jgi:hypothetical protein
VPASPNTQVTNIKEDAAANFSVLGFACGVEKYYRICPMRGQTQFQCQRLVYSANLYDIGD